MLKKLLTGVAALAAGLGWFAPSARAQDLGVQVGGRSWLMYDDLASARLLRQTQADGTTNDSAAAGDAYFVPMWGVTAAIRNPWDADTQIVGSAMYGEADEETVGARSQLIGPTTSLPNGGFVVTTVNEQSTLKRQDYELSLQRRVGDAGLIMGVRYERARVDITQTTVSNGFSLGGSPVSNGDSGAGYDLITARAGLAGGAALDRDRGDDARFWLFGNIMGFAGSYAGATETSGDDAVVFGPDASAGFLWRLTPKVALDARYRGIYFFSSGDDVSQKRVTHGLNVTLTTRF